ncbi:hypothetical protein AB6A40_007708 [Gnathostoma spinigerum]|uniref:SHSP domain-containing protein n=1 Tax=Gnathostoma spinigerum TaxID=75299 RepID=A0ABD6EM14_9BILA
MPQGFYMPQYVSANNNHTLSTMISSPSLRYVCRPKTYTESSSSRYNNEQRAYSSHFRDDTPMYSVNNRQPSIHDSRSGTSDRYLREEGRSRPGSPQVVAGSGDIINSEHGFTIELDVRHFHPSDIKVNLDGSTLSVVGDRIEKDRYSQQTLRRSFTRKYSIPSDIQLNSITCNMTDSGLLIISGSRKGWKETEIYSHEVPTARGTSSAVISNV